MRAAIVGLCAVLMGCGGGAVNPRVRIGTSGAGLQTWSMPITLADRLGYYREEGLDVTLESFPSIVRALQALLGGSIDAAGLSYSQSVQLAADGQQVQAFFIMDERDNLALLVAPGATGRIQRVEDLKGAVIGVSSMGSTSHQFLESVLAAHGMRPSEVSAVGIGVGAPRVAAIESGRVDAAAVAGGDHFYLMKRYPKLRLLVDSSTPEGLRAVYGADRIAGGALSAKREWLAANPETARRLTRALRRTHEWIATHSAEQIRERLPEGFRTEDAAVDLAIIEWGKRAYTRDGRMPEGAPETMRRFLAVTNEKVRAAKIDLAATWTNQYLPEAP